MSRHEEKPWVPKVGHRQKTAYLPRDMRLGLSVNIPKGTLLYGWDEDSGTRQLWQVVSPGSDGESEFVGFVKDQA